MINVLIVGCKPLVAKLYEFHINNIENLKVTGITENLYGTIKFCKKEQVDLIVLDLPEELYFMKQLVENEINIDTILLTAFRNVKNLQLYRELNLVNYLIKPFEFEEFKQAFKNYGSQNSKHKFEGIIVDEDFAFNNSFSKRTLNRVYEFMRINKEFFTIKEISECLKLSNSTIHKYVKYLYSVGEVTKRVNQTNSGKNTYTYKYVVES